MNTVTFDIRPAEPKDADDIASVHEAAWNGAYAGLIPHRALRSMVGRRGPKWWASAIRRAATVLVVEMNGIIVGYTTLGRNRARQIEADGEIYELYLLPEYQGLGLGTRLFNEARSKLRDHNLKGLVVWALEENGGAVSFYHGHGGRDVAEGVEVFDGRALKKIAFCWN